VNYYADTQYLVKAKCVKCDRKFIDILHTTFLEEEDCGKFLTVTSLGLQQQIDKRYACCGRITITESRQIHHKTSLDK
jgi:hypothetical protein